MAPPVLLLMGPTAGGKTAVAMALSRRFPVEIVSVDSAQVFRDMNIGTAKPDSETLAKYPHQLIDLISPEEAYSAARFRKDAIKVIEEIIARGKVPLLVGGTMLYFKALLEGLAELPQACPEIRAEIEKQAATEGWRSVHAELERVDSATAKRLPPSDSQRIQRALEVYRLSGRPLSELIAEGQKRAPDYRFISFGLLPTDRALLHKRIAVRFAEMLDSGLEKELTTLRQKYRLNAELPSMRCVGYRQAWAVQEGLASPSELLDRGIYATRQLAKRQITWLTNSFEAEIFDCLAPDLDEKVSQRVGEMLSNR